jgi:hypothetical protein
MGCQSGCLAIANLIVFGGSIKRMLKTDDGFPGRPRHFFPRFPGNRTPLFATPAIRINVVRTGCNRSVERSRYAESLSEER